MLASRDHVYAMLRCPISGGPVGPVESSVARLECDGHSHPVVDGNVVLVDFDNSVLDRSELEHHRGASAVTRSTNPVRRWVRHHVVSPGTWKSADENAAWVVEQLRSRPRAERTVLIIGGGERGSGTERLYDAPDIDVVAFDVYVSNDCQFTADAHRLPLEDCSVDAVWIQFVLEHVLDPAAVVAEIHRVLRPGGVVYAATPFMQHVHEGAYDFLRFSPSGHRWLFRMFAEEASGVAMGVTATVTWAVEGFVVALTGSRRLGKLAKLLAAPLQLFEPLVDQERARDFASALYFVGRKAIEPLTPAELVAEYAQRN